MSKTLEGLADVIGHDYLCELMIADDTVSAQCTCGADKVFAAVRDEMRALEQSNAVLRRCWEKAEQDHSGMFRVAVFAIIIGLTIVIGLAFARAQP